MVNFARHTSWRTRPGRGSRLAVAIATTGAFLLSSGLVLVTQGSASAAGPNVDICHVTGSDHNPYVFETVNEASLLGPKGHLSHSATWGSAGFWNGTGHAAGDTRTDIIGAYTDSGGVFHPGPVLSKSYCNAASTPAGIVTGQLTITGPDCPLGAASFATSGANITFLPASGPTSAGAVVTTVGTTDPGYVFSDGTTSKTFTKTVGPFDPAACGGGFTIVTPAVSFTVPSCTVAAAWSGTVNADISYALTSGTVGAGNPVVVTATALNGTAFDAAGSTTQDFPHTYSTYDATKCPGAGGGGGGAGGGAGGGGAGGGGAGGGTPGAGGGGVVTSPPSVVTTRAPRFTDATCSAPTQTAVKLPGTAGTATAGALLTSVLDGVTYTATGSTAVGHTVVVKAVPGATQVLSAGSVTRWAHTFAKPTHCGTAHHPSSHQGGGVEGQHVVHHSTSAPQGVAPASAGVPTTIDSGLVGATVGPATSALAQLRALGIALVLAGGLLLLGGASWLGLGRRRRGALV